MTKYIYSADSLIGGSSGALDYIDGDILKNGDVALVADSTSSIFGVYVLNIDSTAAENSPYIISPDTNAGNKRWVLTSTQSSSFLTGPASYSFIDDEDTKIYSPGSNQIAIAVGGVDAISIDSTSVNIDRELIVDGVGSWTKNESDDIYYNDGSVGIGTTTPQAKLNVNGTLLVGSGTTDLGDTTFSNTTGTYVIDLNSESSNYHRFNRNLDAKWSVGLDASNYEYKISEGNALGTNDRLTILQGGNVGIGTEDPQTLLHIASTSTTQLTIERRDASVSDSNAIGILNFRGGESTINNIGQIACLADGDWANDDSPSKIQFRTTPSGSTSANNNVVIDKDGFVGIGEVDPLTKLHLKTVDDNTKLTFERQDSAVFGGAPVGEITFRAGETHIDDVASILVESAASWSDYSSPTRMIFKTTSIDSTAQLERVRIHSDGNVGIGITPNTRLHVSTDQQQIATFESTDNRGNILIADNNTNTYVGAEDGNTYISNTGNALTDGQLVIDSAGDVGIGTTTPGARLHISKTDALPFITIERIDTEIFSSNNIGEIRFRGGETTIADIASIVVEADATWDADDSPSNMSFWTTPAGSTTQAERMRIDSDGNVGIGTIPGGVIPGALVDIQSTLIGSAGSYTNHPVLRLTADGDLSYNIGDIHGAIEFYSNDESANFPAVTSSISSVTTRDDGITNPDAGLLFRVATSDANLTDRMIIKEDGYVGIGTTTPLTKLHVAQNLTNPDITIERIDVSVGNGVPIGSIFFRGGETTIADVASIIVKTDVLWDTDDSPTRIEFYTTPAGSTTQTEVVRIDKDGQVGIGITPTAPLHVSSGDNQLAKFASTDSRASILVSDDDTTTFIGAENGSSYISNKSNLLTSGQIVIDSDGNVGIGTSAPIAKLEVKGASTIDGTAPVDLFISDITTSSDWVTGAAIGRLGFWSQDGSGAGSGLRGAITCNMDSSTGAGSELRLQTNDGSGVADRLVIDRNGRVGIGTDGPLTELHVAFDSPAVTLERLDSSVLSGNTIGEIKFRGGETTIADVASIVIEADNAWDPDDSPSRMSFWTTPGGSTTQAERMRIDKDGNVGIGTDNPDGEFEIVKTGGALEFMISTYATSSNNASILRLRRSNNTTESAIETVDGNRLGALQTQGVTSTPSFSDGAKIEFFQNGSSGASYVPCDIVFSTSNGIAVADEQMRIDYDGNVGIGTAEPLTNLHVAKANAPAKISLERLDTGVPDNFGIGYILWRGGETTIADIASIRVIADAEWEADDSPTAMVFYTTPAGSTTESEQMRIDRDGNVGIGAGIPISTLHIADSNAGPIFTLEREDASVFGSATIGSINFRGGESTIENVASITVESDVSWNDYSSPTRMTFSTTPVDSTSQVEVMRIDPDGNVGIGTTSPAQQLDVVGRIQASRFISDTDSTESDVSYNLGSNGLGMFRGGANEIGFATSSTTKLLITNGKIIAMGTTTIPSWDTDYDVLHLGDKNALYSYAGSSNFHMVNNVYYESATVKRIASGYATKYEANNNSGIIDLAVAGTDDADSTITWITGLRVNNDGNVTAKQQLEVEGTTKTEAHFYAGDTDPDSTARINFDGFFYATKCYNPVYNDIADFQDVIDEIIPGMCYYDTYEGAKLCTQRCQMAVMGIASDTFGMSVGSDSNKEKIPVAISGWVLAYVDQTYPCGTALTNNENGYLTEITKEEKLEYPERLIATYKKPEESESWGPEDIEVNNRHWVKVK